MYNFEDIYAAFQPRIKRYLASLVGEDTACDLTQAVFLKVSQSLDSFRGESSLATWLYRIATNLAYDHGDSARVKQQKQERLLAEGESLDDLPDGAGAATDSAYIRQEMNACIREVVVGLPESYRTVLLLVEFEELTNLEAAEVLGVSLDTVKIRLHRARAIVRKAMQNQCSFYHDERNELMCDRKPQGSQTSA